MSHSKSKKSPLNKKEVKFSRKKGNNDGGSPDAKPEGDHIITFIDFLSIAKDQFNGIFIVYVNIKPSQSN